MKSRSIDAKRAAFAQASHWIKHCQLWHAPYCQQIPWGGPNSGSLPLRMIDVQKLCLVAAPAGCQYAALSYKWGNVDQCKLEKDTYEDMHKAGALDYASKTLKKKLPKTIHDAMVVCQGLSIRYLWVDALCIIQDLGEDRDVQIASMGSIYGGAHLTIVAAFGDSADAGLPGISIPRRDRHTPITIKGVSMNTQPRSAAKCLLHSQWYTRGWTFQELVLSRRILAFTQEQMLFFC
ncbi:HET-domain-containing protein, partial [Polyplosphaeria fusca]